MNEDMNFEVVQHAIATSRKSSERRKRNSSKNTNPRLYKLIHAIVDINL